MTGKIIKILRKIKMNLIKNFAYALKEYFKLKKKNNLNNDFFFYAESQSDWDHLEPIVNDMISLGYKNIIKITSDLMDQNLTQKNTFYIGTGAIRTILFKALNAKAMFLTLPDIGNSFLKKSDNKKIKYIYIFHSLMSTHRIYTEKAFDNYDIILCPGKFHLNEILIREKLYKLQEKFLVEYGYPKIDTLIEKKKLFKSKNKKKTVLIAPTWGDSSIVKSCLVKIIKILLDKDYKVMLRLHTMSKKYDKNVVKYVKKNFLNKKNFFFEEENKNLNTFLEADFLISDWSGSAFEFAFLNLRPVIFINTKPKINNKNWQKLNLVCIEDQVRKKIGKEFEQDNISKIPDFINFYDQSEDEQKKWKENIFKAKEGILYDFNKSKKDILKKLLGLI